MEDRDDQDWQQAVHQSLRLLRLSCAVACRHHDTEQLAAPGDGTAGREFMRKFNGKTRLRQDRDVEPQSTPKALS